MLNPVLTGLQVDVVTILLPAGGEALIAGCSS